MATNGEWKECLVVCKTGQGVELRGSLLRLTRFSVAFELYNPHAVLRTSEVLSDFRILANDDTLDQSPAQGEGNFFSPPPQQVAGGSLSNWSFMGLSLRND